MSSHSKCGGNGKSDSLSLPTSLTNANKRSKINRSSSATNKVSKVEPDVIDLTSDSTDDVIGPSLLNNQLLMRPVRPVNLPHFHLLGIEPQGEKSTTRKRRVNMHKILPNLTPNLKPSDPVVNILRPHGVIEHKIERSGLGPPPLVRPTFATASKFIHIAPSPQGQNYQNYSSLTTPPLLINSPPVANYVSLPTTIQVQTSSNLSQTSMSQSSPHFSHVQLVQPVSARLLPLPAPPKRAIERAKKAPSTKSNNTRSKMTKNAEVKRDKEKESEEEDENEEGSEEEEESSEDEEEEGSDEEDGSECGSVRSMPRLEKMVEDGESESDEEWKKKVRRRGERSRMSARVRNLPPESGQLPTSTSTTTTTTPQGKEGKKTRVSRSNSNSLPSFSSSFASTSSNCFTDYSPTLPPKSKSEPKTKKEPNESPSPKSTPKSQSNKKSPKNNAKESPNEPQKAGQVKRKGGKINGEKGPAKRIKVEKIDKNEKVIKTEPKRRNSKKKEATLEKDVKVEGNFKELFNEICRENAKPLGKKTQKLDVSALKQRLSQEGIEPQKGARILDGRMLQTGLQKIINIDLQRSFLEKKNSLSESCIEIEMRNLHEGISNGENPGNSSNIHNHGGIAHQNHFVNNGNGSEILERTLQNHQHENERRDETILLNNGTEKRDEILQNIKSEKINEKISQNVKTEKLVETGQKNKDSLQNSSCKNNFSENFHIQNITQPETFSHNFVNENENVENSQMSQNICYETQNLIISPILSNYQNLENNITHHQHHDPSLQNGITELERLGEYPTNNVDNSFSNSQATILNIPTPSFQNYEILPQNENNSQNFQYQMLNNEFFLHQNIPQTFENIRSDEPDSSISQNYETQSGLVNYLQNYSHQPLPFQNVQNFPQQPSVLPQIEVTNYESEMFASFTALAPPLSILENVQKSNESVQELMNYSSSNLVESGLVENLEVLKNGEIEAGNSMQNSMQPVLFLKKLEDQMKENPNFGKKERRSSVGLKKNLSLDSEPYSHPPQSRSPTKTKMSSVRPRRLSSKPLKYKHDFVVPEMYNFTKTPLPPPPPPKTRYENVGYRWTYTEEELTYLLSNGMYVIERENVSLPSHSTSIWRVIDEGEGSEKIILQEFEPHRKNSGRWLHISNYTETENDVVVRKWGVRRIEMVRDKRTIFNSFLPVFAQTLCSSSNVSVAKYYADNRVIIFLTEIHKGLPELQVPFTNYLRVIIYQSMDSRFLNNIISSDQEIDPRFAQCLNLKEGWNKINHMIHEACKLFLSNSKVIDLAVPFMTWPKINGSRNKDEMKTRENKKCDVCKERAIESFVDYVGTPYDRSTLLPLTDHLNHLKPSKPFAMCHMCSNLSRTVHQIFHLNFNILRAVHTRISGIVGQIEPNSVINGESLKDALDSDVDWFQMILLDFIVLFGQNRKDNIESPFYHPQSHRPISSRAGVRHHQTNN